jgi:opacity protein-like surface antigen
MNKIQKLLLGLAATAVISPVFAESNEQFYVTVGGGVVMQTKNSSETYNGMTAKFKKPKTSGQMLVGVGYYAVENVRVEAVFVKPFVGDSKVNITDNAGNLLETGKLKGEINSLQVRGYVNLVDISDLGKLYAGAGLGWAQIKPKLSSNNNGSAAGKKTNTLAWLVGVGANFDVADGVKLGTEYNYQSFGKGKFKNDNSVDFKPSFDGHAFLAKLQFDI